MIGTTWTEARACSGGNCVQVRWTKATASGPTNCVEVRLEQRHEDNRQQPERHAQREQSEPA